MQANDASNALPFDDGDHFNLGDYFDLGDYHRPITTASPEASLWFDRGLIWSYGFNHEEAVACFERAAAADPDCSMAYWGIAYALGPNYNKPWEFFDEAELSSTVERTHVAVSRAQELSGAASEVERDLIAALALRFPTGEADGAAESWSVWNSEYAAAMARVGAAHPEDLDVAALSADALMNQTPWELWDLRTGEPAEGAATLQAQTILEAALALPGGLSHPGLLHFYIHLVEMSGAPEKGLIVADHLRGLVPDAGHLNHMPSHLDVLCGDYRAAITANTMAIEADERFVAYAGALNFYTLYRAHDLHFRIYAAMFLGQSRVALQTVELLERAIPEELLRVTSPPMADWLEGFLAMRVHTLIRFGRWEEVLALELPADRELYCVSTAMTHYARGVAFAATRRVTQARAEQAEFLAARARVPESRTIFNNTCLDILAVAEAMLAGEIAYREGDYETAYEQLRGSIALDDALPYDEPWAWMQPTRHAYGALLMEQGHLEEAAAVYAADLGLDDSLPRAQQHPGNVWSLHGYHECLRRLGRDAEAAIIGAQLKLAVAVADVPIVASCACRLSAFEQ